MDEFFRHLDAGKPDEAQKALRRLETQPGSEGLFSLSKARSQGESPIHQCARNGYEAMIATLARLKADIEEKNEKGETALIIACQKGNIAVVNQLIQLKALAMTRDSRKWQAIHYAVEGGFLEIVEALAKYSSQVLEQIADNENTVMHIAAQNGRDSIIRFLHSAHANLNSKNKDGNTPLHLAVVHKHENTIRFLVELGADRHAVNSEGFTASALAKDKFQAAVPLLAITDEAPIKSTPSLMSPSSVPPKLSNIVHPEPQQLDSVLQNEANPRPDTESAEYIATFGFLSFLVFLLPNPFRSIIARTFSSYKADSEFTELYQNSREYTERDGHRSRRMYTVLNSENVFNYFEILARTDFNLELLVYLVHLIAYLILVVWFIPVSILYEESSFLETYFSSGNNPNFQDVTSVNSIDGVYSFLSTTIAVGLYINNGTIENGATLFGKPLLRQIRIDAGSCKIYDTYTDCYGFFRNSELNKNPFGPENDPKRYTFSENWPVLLSSFVYFRDTHISPDSVYGTGAHAITMPYGLNSTLSLITQLQNDGWIDRSTRAVALDFSLINGDSGILTSIEFLFEFSPTGLITATSRINNFPLILVKGGNNSSQLIYFIFYILTGLTIAFRDVPRIFADISQSDLGFWEIFEVISELSTLAIIVVISYFIKKSDDIYDIVHQYDNPLEPSIYVNFQTAANVYIVFQCLAGVVSLISFAKILKFFRLNNSLNLLGKTLSLALKDLLAFVIIFCVIFVSYAFQGYFYFGPHNIDFHDFLTSIVSMFRQLAGDSDYSAMQTANPVMAPPFLLSFIILVILILVNVFIAILNEYYNQAKEELDKKEREQRKKFSNEADYDILDQLRSLTPHVRPTGEMKQLRILQGEIVVVIPADQPGREENELAKILYPSKIKVLVMRSGFLDHRVLLNIFKNSKLLQFRHSSRRATFSLLLRGFNQVMKDTYEHEGIKISLKKLHDQGMLLVCEALEDVLIDEPLYCRGWSYSKVLFMQSLFQSLWFSRMYIVESSKFMTNYQLARILRRLQAYHNVQEQSGNDSDDITVEKLNAYLETLKQHKSKEWINSQYVESIIEELKSKDDNKATLISRSDLIREIQIDHALKYPDRLSIYSTSDLEKEVKYIFDKLPSTCLNSVTREELIASYRPRPMSLGGISYKIVEIMDSYQDRLGEYIHDVWAHDKLSNGWGYAPVRDNEKRLHHQLVAYDELSESEKSYDRNIARKVIGLILQWGYTIHPPNEKGFFVAPKLDVSQYDTKVKSGYKLNLPHFKDNTHMTEFEPLMEVLAESIHDEWAKGRMEEGYRYGLVKEKKELGELTPYQFLKPEVKESNRNSVKGVIEYLLWTGHSIVSAEKKTRVCF